MTLPDGHMVVADVPLPIYTEGRGLSVEVEEAVEDLSSRQLGRLSEATFGQLVKCISRFENNSGCCCCCRCVLILLVDSLQAAPAQKTLTGNVSSLLSSKNIAIIHSSPTPHSKVLLYFRCGLLTSLRDVSG